MFKFPCLGLFFWVGGLLRASVDGWGLLIVIETFRQMPRACQFSPKHQPRQSPPGPLTLRNENLAFYPETLNLALKLKSIIHKALYLRAPSGLATFAQLYGQQGGFASRCLPARVGM